MTDNKKTVGGNIRQFRKDRGITPEQMAVALDCTVMQVYNYENGRTRVTAEVIVNAAKALKVKPCDLFKGVK